MRALFLLCLTGCLASLPSPTPMTSVRDDFASGRAKCLVVFLPGAGDSATDFERYGFVAAMRQRGLSVDLVSAQATLGYYVKGLAVDRLAADVIGPARARGYEQTWLIGMSMGGMGTLLYSHAQPDQVTGVLALAPYLGERPLLDEIRGAGGLAAWSDSGGPADSQRELWRWLKAMTSGKARGPELYVGWGTEDRLREADSLLAATLPKDHVITVPGGHKWTTWKKVLDQFLVDSSFTRSCAP